MPSGMPGPAAGPFVTAFELSPEVVVVTEGPEHRVVSVNEAGRLLLGGEFEGRRVAAVLEGLPPEGVAAWAAALAGHVRRVDGWCLSRRGGGPEVWFDAQVAPWHDPDGQVRGVVAHLQDVTERVHQHQFAEARDHDMTTALQEIVLPQDLPVVPGVELAAAYLLAAPGVGVGGDWFDVVPGADGVSLVVGDVVGRGLGAAAAMAAVRAVLRARLAAGADPEEALRSADAFARGYPDAVGTTVCVAQVEHGSGRVRYCTAGHPPPLTAAPGGTAHYLPRSGAGPLGTGPAGTPCEVAEHRLGDDEMLLLYTDGAVERPSRSTSQNTLDLADLVSRAVAGPADPDQALAGTLCDDVLARLVRWTGSGDDIALLAAQRVPEPARLSVSLPAEPGAVRAVRRALGEWLAPLAVRDLDEMAVQHALGEVVANAVVHGTPEGRTTDADPPAEISVEGRLGRDGRLVVSVADTGVWVEAAPGHRGRGLGLARGFTERVTIERGRPGAEGTTVTLELPLSRAAQLFESSVDERVGAPESAQADDLLLDDDGSDVLVVAGAVDLTSAEHLHSALLRRSVGGTAPLTVDLTGVGFLGSVGVRVLFEALAWGSAESPGSPADETAAGIQLVAAPGSAAQHVLETVGLPYRSSVVDDLSDFEW